MYSQISIYNLRSIVCLSVDRLSRINLIVGRNNAGKTTFLEGLFLLGSATNPVFAATLGQLRGQRLGGTSADAAWRPLFTNLDPRVPVELEGRWDGELQDRSLRIEAMRATRHADALEPAPGGGGGTAAVTQEFEIGGLTLRYTDAEGNEATTSAIFDPKTGEVEAPSKERADFVRTTFLSARAYGGMLGDARQFSNLLKNKRERDVIEAVKIIDPRVERIEVLSEPGGPAVYVDLGLPALVPLPACGEGFLRLFSIVVALTASSGGLLLIDEIDNGLHYSVMDRLWRVLWDLATRHNVQIFGTTHNEDVIRAALGAFAAEPAALQLFRIDLRNGQHHAIPYDEGAREAVIEQHFEVRG